VIVALQPIRRSIRSSFSPGLPLTPNFHVFGPFVASLPSRCAPSAVAGLSYPSTKFNPNSQRLTLLQTVCRCENPQLICNQANPNSFAKTPRVGGTCANLTVGSFSFALDFLTLCFHNLTNPFSRNPFQCTSIQNPRGVGTRLGVPPECCGARQFCLATVNTRAQDCVLSIGVE
jgi:hypothetical protein